MLPEPASSATCANCGAKLRGRYCSACGEEALTAEARTVSHFVRTALLDEAVQFDSRFWQTARLLLFKPGQLSLEFVAGRRRRYVGPVKLLLSSILFFALATSRGFIAALFLYTIALSVAPTAPPRGATVRESVMFIDRFGVLERALTNKVGPGDGPTGIERERFQDRITRFAQPLAFGNVFFLAGGLFLLFRRRWPLYVDHLVFGMHTVTFVLLSSLLMIPAAWIEPSLPAAKTALVLVVIFWQFGYLTTAIRRMYFPHRAPAGARGRAFGVAVLLYVLNGLFVTVVQMIAGAIAIAQL